MTFGRYDRRVQPLGSEAGNQPSSEVITGSCEESGATVAWTTQAEANRTTMLESGSIKGGHSSTEIDSSDLISIERWRSHGLGSPRISCHLSNGG